MGVLAGVKLHRVDSMAELDACRQWVSERRETPLGVDTESGGLSPHRHRHRLTQIGDKRHGWAFPPGWFGAANEIITGYDRGLVMHNRPYDWQVLAVQDSVAPRWECTDDTLTAGHIADSLKLAGLKPRAAQEVDPSVLAGEQVLSEGMEKQRWSWDTVPDDWMPYWLYGALDPVATCWLWEKFTPAMRQFRPSYDLELATTRVSAAMMMAGMRIDVPFIHQKIADISQYTGKAHNWLQSEFGLSNVNANAQVERALNAAGIPTLVYTDQGNPSFSKESMKYYAAEFPQHKGMLDAIKWCKKGESIINRYLMKFLELRGADDVMHYTINTCRARTSRQSVTDPPMQTFDRDEPAIRGSFVPRPGWVFITIDADQIEARLAAHFSGDRRMIEDFRYCDANGLSFFIEMSSRIYSERMTKKDPRYTYTKNATYAQIYGSSLETAAVTAGVPVETMRPAYMGFREMYPGVAAMMNRIIREAKAASRPSVKTLYGRNLYCYRGKEYSLQDFKIQGSAAEIMKQGTINLDAGGLGEYLRLSIHDEILMECPKEMAQDVLTEATRILTDRDNFAVPLTWGGSILSERWKKT